MLDDLALLAAAQLRSSFDDYNRRFRAVTSEHLRIDLFDFAPLRPVARYAKLAAFYLRWRVRAVAYTALLRDEYPPFGDGPYPVELELSPPEEPRDNPDSYVGLEAPSAERRALEHGWSTVRKLPPGAIITMEYRFGRLNLEVEDGRVKRAWKG